MYALLYSCLYIAPDLDASGVIRCSSQSLTEVQ